MPSFRLTLAYDGTGFVGWQRQASGTSIQALVEDALRELDGRDAPVAAAGRTDAGVHASGQVASVSLKRAIDAAGLVRALNAHLPDAVRVLGAAPVEETFHARFQAKSKTYVYRVWNDDVLSPFELAFSWHVRAPLDSDAMASASRLLEGHHDFAAFQAAGSEPAATDRVILRSRVHSGATGAPDDSRFPAAPHCWSAGLGLPAPALVLYEIAGTGFLRHMVRNIVGTLVEIGSGRRSVEWMAEVLAGRDRARAGPTAPATGLFLVAVEY